MSALKYEKGVAGFVLCECKDLRAIVLLHCGEPSFLFKEISGENKTSHPVSVVILHIPTML